MDLGTLKQAGQQLIVDMRNEWQWVSIPGHEFPPPSSVGQKAKGLEVLIVDFLQSLPTSAPSCADWFNLGLEVARTWYCPPPHPIFRAGDEVPLVRLTSPAARARPLWSIPVLVSELCHRLNVQQDDVLPEVEGDGPYESTLPNLPDCSYAPAWIRIEAGIARLSALARDKPAGRRPKSDRDQLWLKSFEDETSGTTFNSLAGIRAKWNADHPQEQVTREVVKKGIKKAREERQTSQSHGGVPS
jgi:hypothetical protein